MNLKEFEGKLILRKYGLNIPKSTLICKEDAIPKFKKPVILKAQTFSGKRKAGGGIMIVKSQKEMSDAISDIFSKEINGEKVCEILIEELINTKKELYLSITLDTKIRRPLLVICCQGGSDIEELKENSPQKIKTLEINVLDGIDESKLRELTSELNLSDEEFENFFNLTIKLFQIYTTRDLKLLEINPLALTNNGFYILDTKIIIDDNGLSRQEFPFERTTGYRKRTSREKEANLIDEDDHKGVSGKTFIDMDGDIGVMASGGGASIIAMDALISYGAKPANYTEYSGNPPAYKVEKLTKIVLDKENLSGLWIVGGIANFTDIYETLKAIVDVLVEKKINFPVVIRRGGPNEKEAFELIRKTAKKHNLNVSIYGRETPITLCAKYMAEASNNFKKEVNNGNTN